MTVPKLPETQGNRINRRWWIQDDAPAHRNIAVKERLNDLFGNRIVSLSQRTEWPSISLI